MIEVRIVDGDGDRDVVVVVVVVAVVEVVDLGVGGMPVFS